MYGWRKFINRCHFKLFICILNKKTFMFIIFIYKLQVFMFMFFCLFFLIIGFWDLELGTCYAHDGSGYRKVELLDKKGCPVFKRVAKVERRKHGNVIYMFLIFEAFKFPDRVQSYFECGVNVCKHKCQSVRICSFNN